MLLIHSCNLTLQQVLVAAVEAAEVELMMSRSILILRLRKLHRSCLAQ
jgi:hypothetical protein